MGKRYKHILNEHMGKVTEEICTNLYEKSIASVYDYCGKVKIPNSHCKPCEADTPTIITRVFDTCALCGNQKEIQETY